MQRIIYFLMAIAISFTTTVGYAKTVKFAILADVHVTPGNLNDEKIKDVVAEINGSDADVVKTLTGILMRRASMIWVMRLMSSSRT